MGKYTDREDYRVVVIPRQPGDYGIARVGGIERDHKQWLSMMEEIKRGIKRHVDDVGGIYLEWDEIVYCDHCHLRWEEDPETGEPYCCNEAIDEWRESILTTET